MISANQENEQKKKKKLTFTKEKVNLLLSSWRKVISQLGTRRWWKRGFILPETGRLTLSSLMAAFGGGSQVVFGCHAGSELFRRCTAQGDKVNAPSKVRKVGLSSFCNNRGGEQVVRGLESSRGERKRLGRLQPHRPQWVVRWAGTAKSRSGSYFSHRENQGTGAKQETETRRDQR